MFLAATEDRGVELRMHGYDLASVLAEMQEVQPLCSYLSILLLEFPTSYICVSPSRGRPCLSVVLPHSHFVSLLRLLSSPASLSAPSFSPPLFAL